MRGKRCHREVEGGCWRQTLYNIYCCCRRFLKQSPVFSTSARVLLTGVTQLNRFLNLLVTKLHFLCFLMFINIQSIVDIFVPLLFRVFYDLSEKNMFLWYFMISYYTDC